MAGVTLTKPVLEIDGSCFDDLDGFYREVTDKLIRGAAWGHNLDALDDILYGGFGTPEEGFVLRWLNSDRSRQVLGYPETIRWREIKKQRCHPSNIPHVEEDLAAARRGEGPTLFDILVEIIEDHREHDAGWSGPVELELG